MDSIKILHEIKNTLIEKFGNEIDQVILFGSYAADKQKAHSDFDLLIINSTREDWKFKNEVYDAIYEFDLRYDLLTDIKIIKKSELQQIRGKQPFFQKAIENGVAV